MRKTLAYALMLTATLGLAACDKASENKAEDARESAQDAQKSMNDAVEQSNEAAEERAKEQREEGQAPVMPSTPSTTPPAKNP